VIIFLDTSSLLKLYHNEIGTEELLNVLSYDVEEIHLSELAILEFCSAIWKKTRTSEVKNETANQIIKCFEQDFTKFQWITVNYNIIKQAQELLMKYGSAGLRTLDAIQLACAMTLKDKSNISFITADKLLHIFFKKEELRVL